MGDSIFRSGGPHNVRRTGNDTFQFSITIPEDQHGRIARQCPDSDCSPGYFKVKQGTGITDEQASSYCPYCRHECDPSDFTTREQIRYAEDLVTREAEAGAERMLKKSLGLNGAGRKRVGGEFLSLEISMKSSPQRFVRHPLEDELQRAVTCPFCGLDHSVFGLALWCPDCGRDIFLTHVAAEYGVVRAIVSDVERRRESLGPRVAAKDLENCLEDTVSIFEAALKVLVVRRLRRFGKTEGEIQAILRKRIRNSFQNLERTTEIFGSQFDIDVRTCVVDGQMQSLREAFEKRHPIAHNLGVVDRKYLETTLAAEKEGKEIRVSSAEVEAAVEISLEFIRNLSGMLASADAGES